MLGVLFLDKEILVVPSSAQGLLKMLGRNNLFSSLAKERCLYFVIVKIPDVILKTENPANTKVIHIRLFCFPAIFIHSCHWYFMVKLVTCLIRNTFSGIKYVLWLVYTQERNFEFWKSNGFHPSCVADPFFFLHTSPLFFGHADLSCMVICCKPHGTISNCDGESSNCKHSSLKQVVVLNWAL